MATPSPDRELSEAQEETSNPGNATLNYSNVNVQGGLGENSSINQLTEPSLLNCEIQVWTQIMEQKNDNKIETMKEEMVSKFEAILKEVKSHKTASTMTILDQISTKSKIHSLRDPKLPSL